MVMNKSRQCPRCSADNPITAKVCGDCETSLRQKRFHMDRDRIKHIHVVALSQKGLTDEQYHDNLAAVGVETCKDMRREQFFEFMARMKRLPDSPTWVNRHRRAA